MKVETFHTFAEMQNRAVFLLREHLSRVCDGPHAVLLPGGQTPFGLYQAIEQSPPEVAGDLHLMVTDERHVPLESPESNFGRMRAMVSALGLDDSRVIRVHTELSLEDAADRYHADIASFLERKGRMTLAFLGLGTDGHTASLFNREDIRRGEGWYAIAATKETGQDRISVTQNLLSKAEQIVFLTAGPDKAEIVHRIADTSDPIVAAEAVRDAGNVELWFSKQASSSHM